MSDSLEQPVSDELVLLMYLAGELAPADHAAVDRRLSTDAPFTAALGRLRETDGQLRAGMALIDAATPLPIDPAVAVRNVSRLLRQRKLRPSAPAQPAARLRTFPRWAFPAATAAAVLIAATLVWRTLSETAPGGAGTNQVVSVAPDVETIEMEAADSLMRDTEEWALAGGQMADDLSGTGIPFDLPTDVDAAQP